MTTDPDQTRRIVAAFGTPSPCSTGGNVHHSADANRFDCKPLVPPPHEPSLGERLIHLADDMERAAEALKNRAAPVMRPRPDVACMQPDLSKRAPLGATIARARAALDDIECTTEAIDL
ncbi:MAG: hypothetical protein ACYDCI_00095 [Candidatus Limnocylindrales bacterium]